MPDAALAADVIINIIISVILIMRMDHHQQQRRHMAFFGWAQRNIKCREILMEC